MRPSALERVIAVAMIAGAALMVASCGHHGASNESNGSGGESSVDSAAASLDNAANSPELGDNDEDSNVAQVDGANSTTVDGKAGGSAAGNGAM